MIKLGTIYSVIIALALFGQMSCSEKETLTPSIIGMWHGQKYTQNVYEFREGGGATVDVVVFGQTIYTNKYAWWLTGDVLEMYDIEQKSRKRYDLAFPTDSTATLSGDQVIGQITIVRFK